MKKNEFKQILDYLFGDIPGIDTHKICFDDYNYEKNIDIITQHLNIEEIKLKSLFPEYDILALESPKIEKMIKKLSSSSILYYELDEKLFYHDMLLNKYIIGKIIYHKILKDSRKFKINEILS